MQRLPLRGWDFVWIAHIIEAYDILVFWVDTEQIVGSVFQCNRASAPLHTDALFPSGELNIEHCTARRGVIFELTLFTSLFNARDCDDRRFGHELLESTFRDFSEGFFCRCLSRLRIGCHFLNLNFAVPIGKFQLYFFTKDSEPPWLGKGDGLVPRYPRKGHLQGYFSAPGLA